MEITITAKDETLDDKLAVQNLMVYAVGNNMSVYIMNGLDTTTIRLSAAENNSAAQRLVEYCNKIRGR